MGFIKGFLTGAARAESQDYNREQDQQNRQDTLGLQFQLQSLADNAKSYRTALTDQSKHITTAQAIAQNNGNKVEWQAIHNRLIAGDKPENIQKDITDGSWTPDKTDPSMAAAVNPQGAAQPATGQPPAAAPMATPFQKSSAAQPQDPSSGFQSAAYANAVPALENTTGNPAAKNASSSASGDGQFQDGTWMELAKNPKYAQRLGVKPGMSDADILKLKDNSDYARAGIAAYGEVNAPKLQNSLGSDYKSNGADVYLAHHYGADGATNIIKAVKADASTPINKVVGNDVFKANEDELTDDDGDPLTVGEYYYSKVRAYKKAAGIKDDGTAAPQEAPQGAAAASSPVPAQAAPTATAAASTAPADLTPNPRATPSSLNLAKLAKVTGMSVSDLEAMNAKPPLPGILPTQGKYSYGPSADDTAKAISPSDFRNQEDYQRAYDLYKAGKQDAALKLKDPLAAVRKQVLQSALIGDSTSDQAIAKRENDVKYYMNNIPGMTHEYAVALATNNIITNQTGGVPMLMNKTTGNAVPVSQIRDALSGKPNDNIGGPTTPTQQKANMGTVPSNPAGIKTAAPEDFKDPSNWIKVPLVNPKTREQAHKVMDEGDVLQQRIVKQIQSIQASPWAVGTPGHVLNEVVPHLSFLPRLGGMLPGQAGKALGKLGSDIDTAGGQPTIQEMHGEDRLIASLAKPFIGKTTSLRGKDEAKRSDDIIGSILDITATPEGSVSRLKALNDMVSRARVEYTQAANPGMPVDYTVSAIAERYHQMGMTPDAAAQQALKDYKTYGR